MPIVQTAEKDFLLDERQAQGLHIQMLDETIKFL